ncbi:MAG: BlaI/MecI/CopY family transcriptional regulator [Bacteroidales bacterium]|jgi:predicted transcriptional regulator|nr:BlaI/MecI/CopY family transcriptional regulator [Bacteroidales bacterium]
MKQRLTAKEEALMDIFWKKGDLCIRELLDNIPDPKPNYNTVATQVKFLEDKGFLRRKPIANTFIYKVAISEKAYRGVTVGDVVKKYYNNSYASLISQFVEEEKLRIDELKELIEQIEKEK